MVSVEWLGHSCFRVAGQRVTVVIDPFSSGVGLSYPPVDVRADLVLVTHEHRDHNDVGAVKGNPKVIRGPGEWKEPVAVKGIATRHGGSSRELTAVYRFQVDDVIFCHLGDLGEVPDEGTVRRLRPTDVLMIPVGGTYTIDNKEADEVVRIIEPRLAIPMHYGNQYVNFPIAPVEKFTAGKQNVRLEPDNAIEISKDSLPEKTQVVVLAAPRPKR